MVESAAKLIGSRGLSATSFSDVLEASGAPRGSIYHHFPEGKKQLAEDAMRYTAERMLAYQRAADGGTPAEILNRFVAAWRGLVAASNGAAGCAIAGVTLDTTSDDTELIDVARETFRAWIALLSEQFTTAGIPAARARAIATATLASMEGSLVLCRAEGNTKMLDAVAKELARLLP